MIWEGRKKMCFSVLTLTLMTLVTTVLFLSRISSMTGTKAKTCPNVSCSRQTTCDDDDKERLLLAQTTSRPLDSYCRCRQEEGTRPLLPYPSDGLCYPAFTQGPCPPDSWLSWNRVNQTHCAPNFCLNQVQDTSLLVPFKKGNVTHCGLLGQPHPSCSNAASVLSFSRNKRRLYPNCGKDDEDTSFLELVDLAGVGVPKTECPEGYYKTEMGHCAREFEDAD